MIFFRNFAEFDESFDNLNFSSLGALDAFHIFFLPQTLQTVKHMSFEGR